MTDRHPAPLRTNRADRPTHAVPGAMLGPIAGPLPDQLHEVATARLRRISQRYTSGRRLLVEVLARAERPLTIPEIVDREASLATSSVYRNLAALELAGVVTKIVTNADHGRYELSEQFGPHHHHLVCTTCGEVNDFTLPPGIEESLDAALRRAARKEGYQPDGHRLDVTGTCAACRQQG